MQSRVIHIHFYERGQYVAHNRGVGYIDLFSHAIS